MNWSSELLALYDRHKDAAGVIEGDAPVLLPISHTTVKAVTEVVVSEEGAFVSAAPIEKGKERTIVPVTVDSGVRGSGIFPMPLHDKLVYTAGDYRQKTGSDKGAFHKAYMAQLCAWTKDPTCPAHVKSVYAYLTNGTLISDLMSCDAYQSPEDFIRFSVVDADGVLDKLYENRTVMNAWSNYYTRTLTETGIDYITGKETVVSGKQPNTLRYPGDKAKLISSNDTRGFTYRGIFKTAEQAVTVGYEESQKIHNALRWIILKQGWHNDSEYFVCFATDESDLPDITESSASVYQSRMGEILKADTHEEYARNIAQAVHGYERDTDTDARVIMLGVDTADGAGQGRLAITYYDEMLKSDYLRSIETWYNDCRWARTRWTEEKKPYIVDETPGFYDIAVAVYGIKSGDRVIVDNHAVKRLTKRLIPCITENRPLPDDLVAASVRNATKRPSYSESGWNRIVWATLAMIRKKIRETEGGIEPMALDKENRNRDYLFGRLLAVYDQIESAALYKEKKERDTNAVRLWNSYVAFPARTTMMLESKTQPYMSKLSAGSKQFFASLKADILGKLGDIDGMNDTALGAQYLVGYYTQREELISSRKHNNEDNENNNEGDEE